MNNFLQGKVIECLRRERRLWTVPELKTSTGIDIAKSKELQSSLKHNPRVQIHKEPHGVFLSYRPQVENVSNADELLMDFRRRCIENGRLTGVLRSLYSDAYHGVEQDLDRLIAEHRLLSMQNDETKEVFLYHDEPSLYLKVDADVRKIMGLVELPGDRADLHRYLDDHKLPVSGPPLHRQQVPLVAKGQKRSRARKRPLLSRKATNVHLGVEWMKETSQYRV